MLKIITVTWGVGSGPTEISAFDKALFDAGIAQYNLIYLSSIIPPGATVVTEKHQPKNFDYGNRLYSVMAKNVSDVEESVWAGLGWLVDLKSGKGIFVEHIAPSKDGVLLEINHSINAMRQYRNSLDNDINHKIVGISRQDKNSDCSYLCALVCAVFEITPW